MKMALIALVWTALLFLLGYEVELARKAVKSVYDAAQSWNAIQAKMDSAGLNASAFIIVAEPKKPSWYKGAK